MNDAFDADELAEVTSSKKVGDKYVARRGKIARPQATYMPNENLGLSFILLNGSRNAHFVAPVEDSFELSAIGTKEGYAACGVLKIGQDRAGTKGNWPIDDYPLDCDSLTETARSRLVPLIITGLPYGEGFRSLRANRGLADQNTAEQKGKKDRRSASIRRRSPAARKSDVGR